MMRFSFTASLRTTVMAAGLALMAIAADPALAQSSKIKIVVNDQAITTMEIANRARLLQVANRLPAGKAATEAEKELIDEALRIAEAARRGIVIPDEAVDAAVASIASRSKISTKQFAAALGQAGVPIATLKGRLRAQMAWGQIVRAKVQQTSSAEKNDLIAQMRREEQGSTATAEDYLIQRVVFTLPANAAAGKVATRRKEAENLRSRFKDCDSGLAMAKGLKEVAVLNVGRKLANEIPEGLRAELKETREGGLTKPTPGPNGIEMYAVCKKYTVNGENALASSSVDAEAFNAQAQAASDSLTAELRQRASIVYR